jgi:hypothetical protein
MNPIVEWARAADPGEAMTHFRGDLAASRYVAQIARCDQEEVRTLDAQLQPARDAWDAYEAGAVLLVQRRVAPLVFAYTAIATKAARRMAPAKAAA